MSQPTGHLAPLEEESIYILREAAALCRNCVLLYSIGKDSSVLLHLARKAFHPAPLPFPLLHVDTTWKFREMIAFRDAIAREPGLDLSVWVNRNGVADGVTPFSHDGGVYTAIMKTQALKQALDAFGFVAAIGGARRDEEQSRAKERVFSLRTAGHHWDPRRQRVEVWRLFNSCLGQGESLRIFPLSNWTELDVWRYIERERIAVVPLYFAKPRPVVRRAGTWIVVDDDRFVFRPGERVETRSVRFRTLGCYPLTGAVESEANTVSAIVDELSRAKFSERAGRLIDQDAGASMERKKREGYF
jgi:sulfate adenylyltransferase subunit 2